MACTSASRAWWVMKMRRASSPRPSCSIERIDTPWSPNTPATWAQHAGLVEHLEVEVVGRLDLVDGADARPWPSWPTDGVRALAQVDGGVDQVAEHGAGRGAAAGAPAVEHQVADRRALDEHGVEALPHRGQRVVDGHHRRVHPHADRRRSSACSATASSLMT